MRLSFPHLILVRSGHVESTGVLEPNEHNQLAISRERDPIPVESRGSQLTEKYWDPRDFSY